MIKKIKKRIILFQDKIYTLLDFFEYARNLLPYSSQLKSKPFLDSQKSLLIVSGAGMNISWAQIWTFLSLAAFKRDYKVIVLTYKKSKLLNMYYSLMPMQKVFFEDLRPTDTDPISNEIKKRLEELQSFNDYKTYYYKDAPIGQIALSTYSRHKGTGLIDLTQQHVKAYVHEWIVLLIQYYNLAETVYQKYNVQALFVTEVFLEEYGAFYYSAINHRINVIRFAGTVRDDSFILQHLSQDNDRIHHSSIAKSSFESIQSLSWGELEEKELAQNFLDRYGDKWHRSKRNQPNTVFMSPEDMRQHYAIPSNKKIAIIYSHILYDTLFFFGTDLFKNYAEWLIESVKAACENDQVEWFVKVHPSNIWRGELNFLLKGKYEEEKLIHSTIGSLPKHVRIIPADNDGISPYSWFQFADYGITVRGTSGLEMAALGKTVICAGTGRYEGNGFTVDPVDSKEYLSILKNIQKLPYLEDHQKLLAKQYAHAIFIRKPFALTSFELKPKKGVKKILASDDIIYIPSKANKNRMADIQILSDWFDQIQKRDLLKGVDYDLES